MENRVNNINKLSDAELLELEKYYIKLSKSNNVKIKNKKSRLLSNTGKKANELKIVHIAFFNAFVFTINIKFAIIELLE